MNPEYHYRVPAKTKFLNFFRRFFQIRFFEKVLANSIDRRTPFLKKLIPPEYLYSPDSWRTMRRAGVRMQLNISNVVDHEIYFNQYETSFVDFVEEQNNIGTFWDVGANIGWTSLQVAVTFPEASIYAFEPSSKNRQRLANHLNTNSVRGNIVPYGLGSGKNTFRLYSVLESNPGMNRILASENDLPFEEIDVVTGDYYWQTIGKPKVDLIKIDVEGFEMAVLNGMEELISKLNPKLFIEVDNENLARNNSGSKELLFWLSDKGYRLTVAQSGRELIPPFIDVPDHFDVIAK
jgi:FkbM family methyltransferase